MKITIKLSTDNAAWEDCQSSQCEDVGNEIANKLNEMINHAKRGHFETRRILDLNGNTTGTITVIKS